MTIKKRSSNIKDGKMEDRKKILKLEKAMIEFYSGDPKRIQHFVKVHSFAKIIGEAEMLDSHTLFVLESAALVHDIGIKPSEEKYGDCTGKHQELEGPAPAKEMLCRLDYSDEDVERICFLVSHHHTYEGISSTDYQILVEADFLVNLYEDLSAKAAVYTAYSKIFKTDFGKYLCKVMFNL